MVFVSMQATLLFVIFECSLPSSNSFKHFMRCLVKVTGYLQEKELFYMNVNFFGAKHIMFISKQIFFVEREAICRNHSSRNSNVSTVDSTCTHRLPVFLSL